MIKIDVYSLFDQTVCAVDWHYEATSGPHKGSQQRDNLAHVSAPRLAHDEQGMLLDLVTEAIDVAFERAAERGGWSALV